MKDAPHWNWAHGYCEKHKGQELPCALCIASGDFTDDGAKKDTPGDPELGTVFFSLVASQKCGFNYYKLLSGEIVKGTYWSTPMSDGHDYHWPDKVYLGVGSFHKFVCMGLSLSMYTYDWPVDQDGHYLDWCDP